jgi:hypothetical protein
VPLVPKEKIKTATLEEMRVFLSEMYPPVSTNLLTEGRTANCSGANLVD